MAMKQKQQGLTLVELMLSLVIGIVLIGGMTQLFIANKRTLQVQNGLATVQEVGRYAAFTLAKSIRSAGFFSCPGLQILTPNVIANSVPGSLASIDLSDIIDGQDNLNAGNTLGAKAGSDSVTIRGGGGSGFGITGNTTPANANVQVTAGVHSMAAGDLILITDCEAADLFRATSVSNGNGVTTLAHASSSNTTNRLSKEYGADAFITELGQETFFVADSGRTNAAGKVIFSLFRIDIAGNQLEMVEGVSDMQIEYGLDVDYNRITDRYVTAASVPNWDQVISVKLYLLVDSIGEVASAPVSYEFVPQGSTAITPAFDDYRLYKEFSQVVSLRNRVQ